MLSRGGVWSSAPRFVAAVDVSQEEKPGLVERIVRTARYLSSGCHGELDVVFGELPAVDAATGKAHATRLGQVGAAQHLDADRLWTLKGDPVSTLPAFAEKQRTDVLVLGALSHQTGITQLVGTLTRRLMDTIACDFILVRPGRFEFPARGRDEEVWAAEAWRNSYSSDLRPSSFA